MNRGKIFHSCIICTILQCNEQDDLATPLFLLLIFVLLPLPFLFTFPSVYCSLHVLDLTNLCYIPTGKDGSKAFVTGEFNKEGLIDDLSGLTLLQLDEVENWAQFYDKDYTYVGKLIGRYYAHDGKPTKEWYHHQKRLGEKDLLKAEMKKNQERYPPCNSQWNEATKGRVYCSEKRSVLIFLLVLDSFIIHISLSILLLPTPLPPPPPPQQIPLSFSPHPTPPLSISPLLTSFISLPSNAVHLHLSLNPILTPPPPPPSLLQFDPCL